MDHDDLGSAADQRARPFALENNRPLLQYPEHDDPDDDSHLARLLYQYHNQPGSLSPASLRFAHHHLTTRGDPPPPPDVPARYHQGAIPTRADSHDFDAVSPDEHYYQSYHDFRYDISWDVPHMVDSPDPQPSVVHPDHGHSLPRRPVAMRNRSLPQNSSDNNARSPSSPAGASLNATAASPGRLQYGKPSVKDLKQRFDQSGQASSIPSPGGVPRRRRNGSDMSDASREVVHSYSALRSGAADQSVPGFGTSAKAPRSQRSRFVPEDQVSNNTQSFASRVGRPRNSNGANPNASPSVAQPPPPPTLAPSPSAHSSQGLLFGEILPDQYETSALGFGIESVRPRRVSESGAEPPSTNLHQRSLSHPDAEPSSPADWYRHVDTTLDPVGADAASDARWHGRSLSDASAQKQHASIPSTTRKATNRNTNLSPSANQASPSSRLPLSVRRLNGPADSSPGPTRSNSPTTLRRQPVTGRGSRATTPTSRAKTPVQGRIPRKAAPEPPNARLEAYIAAPPPKLSPPLRSSRPRQGVSTASTASSRMKMKAPAGPQARGRTPTATPETVRRRKISVGPIDFEQRREHIRLAYSKSLRESQALESRKRAAERRRQELEAAAREAEAKAATAEALDLHHDRASHSPSIPAGDPDAVLLKVEESEVLKAPTRDDLPIASSDFSTHDSAEPVVQPEPAISSMRPRQDHERAQEKPVPAHPTPTIITSNIESPDLGLPGSFPTSTPPLNVEEPPSAVSTTTVTTEFDLDPQRRSLLPPASPQEAPIVVNPPSPEIPASQPTHVRAEYHSPFDEDGDLLDRNEGLLAHRGDIEPSYGTDSESAYGKLHDDTSACVSVLEDDGECDDDPTESIPFPRLEMHDESECCSDLESVHGLTNVKGTSSREDTVANPYAADMDDQARSEDCVSESRFGDGHRASSCATESEAGDHQEEADCLGYQPAPASANLLIPPSTRPAPLNRTSQWTDITVSTPNLADLAKSPVFEGPGSPAYGHVTIFGSQVLSRDSDIARREVETRPQLVERESYNSGSYNSGRSSGYLEYQDPVKANDEAYYGDDLLAQPPSQGTAQNVPYVPSPNHDPPPVPVSPPNSSVDERMSGTFYEPNPYRRTLMDSTREIGEYMDRVQSPLAASANPFGENDRYSGTPSQRDSGLSSERIEGAELPEKERRRLIQRRNVLKELVDTEAVFVRDMNIVEEIYKGTAEACPKLDAKTVKQIFRNTDDIIAFHTAFLVQVKEAVASVYVPKSSRAAPARTEGAEGSESVEISDAKDREVALGTVFKTNIEQMKLAHEGFLRSSDQAAKSLIQIQQDPTVKVWLNECNEVAKELTAAWDLDSLLIKPMQRITKYPNLIITILQHTPGDHPDREALASAKDQLETAIVDINKTKKNFELVGQIVGRKRKESDVRNGFARAFGKRVDKLQVAGNRPPEDPEYAKLNEKFGDDYLRLQVVLRDVEFYTRQVSTYVREFLQYLSSVELVMRLQPGHYPEIESKWVQFNISIRDIEKVALEEHLAQVRKQVIEPFEQVIKAYGNPSLAMKKRQKRRLDYERMEQLKRSGKSSGDPKLQELVEQYEALNDTLKKELPKLSSLTEKVGNICLGNFVNIQTAWYAMWSDKMRAVLSGHPEMPDLDEVVLTFQQDFPFVDEQLASIGILRPQTSSRPSLSTAASADDSLSRKTRSPRPSDVDTMRSRAMSTNTTDQAPYLPTPDFMSHSNSGSFSMSPTGKGLPSPHSYYYRDYYTGIMPQAGSSGHVNAAPGMTPETSGSYRSLVGTGATASTRPSTGRSFDSGGVIPRQSTESTEHRRDSNTTYNSYPPQETRRLSGLFHSALPLPDGADEGRISSRASSRERGPGDDGYNVLWLAASLFEFNIATTKHEAGYPYLTYQAGEIFDVIAEKGELWLAKNQDDPTEQVGWIWSKHFAKLADFS